MAKCYQLFVRHLGHLEQLSILVSSNKLFNNHETSTDTDDQFTVHDLCINLSCTEQVETVSELLDWNKTISLVDVVTKHLIEEITLWHVEDWLLCSILLLDSSVHDLDDFILVSEEHFNLFDVINSLGNSLRKLVQSCNEFLLIHGKSFNIRFISVNVSIELCNLTSLELDLLVKVNLLLSDDVELGDLIINDILSFLESSIDLVDLLLDLFNLLLSLFNHLVAILDLILKMVDELLLLSFLEVVGKVFSSFSHQGFLLLTYISELL